MIKIIITILCVLPFIIGMIGMIGITILGLRACDEGDKILAKHKEEGYPDIIIRVVDVDDKDTES